MVSSNGNSAVNNLVVKDILPDDDVYQVNTLNLMASNCANETLLNTVTVSANDFLLENATATVSIQYRYQ